jgi:hypothetical protein
MSEENSTPQSTGSLNIAADATTIYQSGQLFEITIQDLLGNEVALRQFVNIYNQAVRENKQLTGRIDELKIANAKSELRPQVLIPAALINIVGGSLVGLATNYLTSSTARPVADWLILIAGVVLLVIGSVGPIWYSYSISDRR